MEEKQIAKTTSSEIVKTQEKKKGRSKIKLLFVFIIFIVLIGCFLTLIFLWYGGFLREFVCNSVRSESVIWNKFNCSTVNTTTNNTKEFPLETSNNLSIISPSSEDSNVETVVETSNASVVGIGIVGDNVNSLDQIIGTGFVVSKAGLIVTNRHVVEDENSKYYLSFKDSTSTLEIVPSNIFRDPVNDIALIKIEKDKIPTSIKALPLGNSDSLKLGQTVIAIGNPLGKYSGTVTKGIISGLNREVTITKGFFSTQKEIYSDVIQTDAAINPGNSGGPMINMKGEAIGINFATVEGASNLSFALPINRIKDRIEELEVNGKFKIPYVGVEYRSRILYVKGQAVIGAEIMSVVANSPAQNAGMKVGDIILEFNGSNLENDTLSALIQKTKIGSSVEVIVYRNKAEQTLQVTIGEK